MSTRYFATARTEIQPFLPANISRMLDVGCGAGATTAFVKSLRSVTWAAGSEFVPEEAEKARAVCDFVSVGNIETWDFEREIAAQSLDLILCLDVLEHLVDPWRVVARLSPLLARRGRLIISVPNIRNWKFIRGLLLRGDFHYRKSGLLDRTHLRFFVRDTARDLALAGGLKLHFCGNAHPWKGLDARRMLSLATFHGLDDLMIKQFLIVAEA